MIICAQTGRVISQYPETLLPCQHSLFHIVHDTYTLQGIFPARRTVISQYPETLLPCQHSLFHIVHDTYTLQGIFPAPCAAHDVEPAPHTQAG
jgi:hypothetical protein